MSKTIKTAAAIAFGATAATAGGLDRNYTPIDMIFDRGSFSEISYGIAMPDTGGVDLLGNPIANATGDFGVLGSAIKIDFGERLTFALISGQSYGADTAYGGAPFATLLGGTFAKA